MTDGALPALLRRDRAVVLSGLAAVVVLAWAYLLFGAGIKMEMMDMGGGQMMAMSPEWTLGYGALIFVMWVAMMVAMMLPSAAPAILLAAALDRRRSTASAPQQGMLFASGYLLATVRSASVIPMRRSLCRPVRARCQALWQRP